MKIVRRIILTTALLVVFILHAPPVLKADASAAYTLLYSSNVAGEIEPCG